jgi:periplasmic copper chaperone A
MTYAKTARLDIAMALAAALLALGACHRGPGVSVKRAWVRLPAVAGGAAAGYFTARSNRDDALVGVEAPGARIELHESMKTAGMTGMRPIAAADLPASETIAFAPGGKHLMIFGLDRLKPGGRLRLTFRFRSAPPVEAEARLVGPADGPPGDGD